MIIVKNSVENDIKQYSLALSVIISKRIKKFKGLQKYKVLNALRAVYNGAQATEKTEPLIILQYAWHMPKNISVNLITMSV